MHRNLERVQEKKDVEGDGGLREVGDNLPRGENNRSMHHRGL
jgi:hypothetical protein